MLEPRVIFADRYEVQHLLGYGDRKHTYLARDTKMGRLVAIALEQPDAAISDPKGTQREAEVLGSIGAHDNVVSLYEMHLGGPERYMVFEYLEGGALAAYVEEHAQRGARVPPEIILRFARQLCRGLSHIHQKGALHRDVTLDNIWLDERQVAHLGDFDSAICPGAAGDVRPITTQSCASPEERQGRSLDERSDLYSLGAVLHIIAACPETPVDPARPTLSPVDLPPSFRDLLDSLLASERMIAPGALTAFSSGSRTFGKHQTSKQSSRAANARRSSSRLHCSGCAGKAASATSAGRAGSVHFANAEEAEDGCDQDHHRFPDFERRHVPYWGRRWRNGGRDRGWTFVLS